jgi:hypothetical protein
MKNEFVPYDRALKLKELGFDEPCLARWIEKDSRDGGGIKLEIWNDEDTSFEVISSTKAPLFQRAFRWFRDTHELHYDITLSINSGNQLIGYYILIHKLDGMLVDEDNAIELDHNTPNREEAELACLDKMIEIVELKQQKQ